MPRILISFLAYNTDFEKEPGHSRPVRVSLENSPNYAVHKYYWKYDKHILLQAKDDQESEQRILMLQRKLNEDFPKHIIETHLLGIEDVISYQETHLKLKKLLSDLRSDTKNNISVFVSPGTPAVQVGFFLCHREKLSDHLFQIRPLKYSEGDKPEKLEVEIQQSQLPQSYWVLEKKFSKPLDFKVTPSIQPILDQAKKIALSDAPVLIYGESGTGKEMLARTIHETSPRSAKKYITVNCGAISDSLLESRLFGHLKGAFTDASTDRIGYFEEANGGTLFLDEIADISPYMQQALLRVLQDGEVQKIGDTSYHKVDVRIITATNKELIETCKSGLFRWDLYFRLAVAELSLPSLYDRGRKEREAYLDYFVSKYKAKDGVALSFSKEAKQLILAYRFPGNIREMENLIFGLYAKYAGEKEISLKMLPARLQDEYFSLKLEKIEKDHILKVYQANQKNKQQTADILGISRNTLKDRLRKYGESIEES